MNSSDSHPSPNLAVSVDSLLCPISGQTRMEEVINTITHGVGMAMSLVGLVVLAVYAALQGGLGLFVCCSIFGSTMVLTYTASTLYHSHSHSVEVSPGKRALQVLDHSCIYLLIAGSYTPFTVLVLKGTWGWGLFIFAWMFAIVGIALKLLITRRYPLVETLLYLAMGWAAVVAVAPLKQSLPPKGFALLIAGGLLYSVGTVFYMLRRLPYHHGIWHIFVMAGSACHFFSVYYSLLSKA